MMLQEHSTTCGPGNLNYAEKRLLQYGYWFHVVIGNGMLLSEFPLR